MSQKGMVAMRPKEVHTAHKADYLGKLEPVELHMSSFSHDSISYEVGENGTVDVPQHLVALMESHGFERVPGEKGPAEPESKFLLGEDGVFHPRADVLKQRADKAAADAVKKTAAK